MKLIRNLQRFLKSSKTKKEEPPQRQRAEQNAEPEHPLLNDLNENRAALRSMYAGCSDVVFRSFMIGDKTPALLVYIEGLSDIRGIDEYVIAPLMRESTGDSLTLKQISDNIVSVSKVSEIKTIEQCIEFVSSGSPILLYEGDNRGLSLGLNKWEKRGIDEPIAEGTIRGPREGFTETLAVNTSQLRRIIKSPALKMKSMLIGSYTQTQVVMAYIEGIADKTLIEEVENRLKRIKVDGILESSYIEEMIEDNPFSPFPQILTTERPDVACASLLEGRVAILINGTPFVIIAPTGLFSLLQSAEDYYQRFMVSTFIRWMRYFFVGVALLLPSFYVAILTYHYEMIPTSLLLSIAASREGVPFTALIEALLMEASFEGLREAGARLPKQVGSAVSIVGALVIGQAAVQAGLVSVPMVMVVAITGISSFMMPRYIAAISIRILRFPIIFLAGTLGLLGIMVGIIAVVIHLCKLRSFGVPYLTPLAPMKRREVKDVLARSPLWMMDVRPHLTGNDDKYRQAPGQMPGPSKGNET
ncbi:spore germination protein [Paenibacillus sp. sptzw28]|uniref:spore germination protein n=1 Tax=Paenibacillus sp. sptzw28 TaxID=715179 RepID=UPI001C6E891E|nr:spore germination protein [Paenibacillus sp. sptzw28]QYR21003.1 spore germination protein [Paenibacillus sp. sptzw28]